MEHPSYNTVKVSIDEHVAIVTMSNPSINILSDEMQGDMSAAFTDLGKDPDIWAVVLNSDQKIFSAGVDLKVLRTLDRAENLEMSKKLQRVFLKIERFEHPVICAVHGNCMGGGLELALSCDLRVFDGSVTAAFTECSLGICTGAGGAQRLMKQIGSGKAKRLIFTGERLSAEGAYYLGLCEYLAAAGHATEMAVDVAKTICKSGPKAISTEKKSIMFSSEHGLMDSLEYGNEKNSALFETEDHLEGINAFFEKREPVFHNR